MQKFNRGLQRRLIAHLIVGVIAAPAMACYLPYMVDWDDPTVSCENPVGCVLDGGTESGLFYVCSPILPGAMGWCNCDMNTVTMTMTVWETNADWHWLTVIGCVASAVGLGIAIPTTCISCVADPTRLTCISIQRALV